MTGMLYSQKLMNQMLNYLLSKYFDMALNSSNDKDSLYNLSLSGADGKFGFLDIIENYNGTPAANIAYYSSGMAYYHLKKYDLAIQYLNEFSSKDDVSQFIISINYRRFLRTD